MKTSRQLMDWLAFEDIDPFDESRADLRAARICAAVFNARFGTRERPLPFTMADFMPDFIGTDKPKVPVKQDWRVVKALFKQMSEVVNRG